MDAGLHLQSDMRALSFLVLFAVLPTEIAVGADNTHPYRSRLKRATVGKIALVRVAVGAGIAQIRNAPEKYGGGPEGFAKRLGSGFATHAVKTTVEHVVAARLHEDLNYHRSDKEGIAPRVAYALTSTVIIRNTGNGKRRPAAGRLAGNAAAGAFMQGVLAAGSGAATAGLGLAAEAGVNVVREFLPRR